MRLVKASLVYSITLLLPIWLSYTQAQAAAVTGQDDTTPDVFRNQTSVASAANTYDYVVVGSGPGGGPLAARLAQAGFSVLLIDAGSDDFGTDPIVEIPLFQATASEYKPITWQYFVSHYDDPAVAQADNKFTWKTPAGLYHVGPNPPLGSKPLGIFYPRASTLGGCAEHNAMVATYPADSDWDDIATLTGDLSWASPAMRQHFVNLENNQYLPKGTPGHGFNGWLDISLTDLRLVVKDNKYTNLVKASAKALGKGLFSGLLSTVSGLTQALTTDLNSLAVTRQTTTGLYQVPLSITKSTRARSSQRQFILDTANAVNKDGSKKYKLTLQLNTLVTRVLFDKSPIPRAIGVQYLKGNHLYRADPNSPTSIVTGAGSFFAKREVILAAGTFNTPQILKLSGIGPKAELKAHRIPLVLDSPAVGTNMQDRYEVTVVGRADTGDFQALKGCTFLSTPDDPCYIQWKNDTENRGIYGTNGVPFGVAQRTSVAEKGTADVFIAGLPTNFHGYFPGYSVEAGVDIQHWSWLVLKAHSRNNAGTVTLKSTDPRDVPAIDFKSFTTGGDQDLQAAYEGVVLARKMFKDVNPVAATFAEEYPGPAIQTEADVKKWIKTNAWGHHASCSVPIGPLSDRTHSVLDSKFRVKGVNGLRVVDASVFPKIPSYYIVTAVYIIAEKAASVIIQDAKATL